MKTEDFSKNNSMFRGKVIYGTGRKSMYFQKGNKLFIF